MATCLRRPRCRRPAGTRLQPQRIHGDVAQLGERLVRNEEVTGSIPVISTIVLAGRSAGRSGVLVFSTQWPKRWGWVVLHGALAAPSRPQSAIAGWNASYEVARMAVPGAHVAMKVRSCATRSYELRQDRKVAAVSNRSSVPQGSLAGAVDVPGALEERSRRGARPIQTAGA